MVANTPLRAASAGHVIDLVHEHRVLGRELGAAQQRTTRLAEELGRRIEQQQAELMRLRAALICRDTLLAAAQADLQQLQASVPGLATRQALREQVAQQRQHTQALERALLHAQHQAQRERQRADHLEATLQRKPTDLTLQAAADWVICQTGCISHQDHWRVQDRCKRTGHPCVLVADVPKLIRPSLTWPPHAPSEPETTTALTPRLTAPKACP